MRKKARSGRALSTATLGWSLALAWAPKALALPIGFGINQGELEYSEVRNEHFHVYYDRRVPTEGMAVLNALEHVRPTMERWFDVKRQRPLPVIMSAVTSNASFANLITDAIELQTMGQGGRDLAWHEYVHSTMYRRFDSIFGPAGNILNVVWMPAWFLEGLAETLSVSVGSDVTAGIERYQALTGDWPSYDRLHSLYAADGFAMRGYATAGGLTSYVLRQGDAHRLPSLLGTFYDYTQPWWWPWAALPFNGFLPMDAALEEHAKANGKSLYESYKRDAKAFWKKAYDAPHLLAQKGPRRSFATVGGLRSNGAHILHVARVDDEVTESALTFDPQTGWAVGSEKSIALNPETPSFARLVADDKTGGVEIDQDLRRFASTIIVKPKAEAKAKSKGKAAKAWRLRREAYVYELWESQQHYIWLEEAQAQQRLCFAPKDVPASLDEGASAKKAKMRRTVPVSCPMRVNQPTSIRALAVESENAGTMGTGIAKKLWLAFSEERLGGTVTTVRAFDTASKSLGPIWLETEARPMAMALAGDESWLMMAERNQRTLRRYDSAGRCQGMLRFKDHLLSAAGLDDGSLVVGVYGGSAHYVMKLPRAKRKELACAPADAHTSPLLVAARDPKVSFEEALERSYLWETSPQVLSAAESKALATSSGLDQDLAKTGGSVYVAEKAPWRGRPVLAFPWIGAEDALGMQFGVVSIPLMDHLQNETVRATFLYGPASRFPYSEIQLLSTRFKSTLSLTAYRQQTYNGLFRRASTGETMTGYLQEKGLRFESSTYYRALGGSGSLNLGIKGADLQPYLGPTNVRHGALIEPSATLSLSHAFSVVSLSNYVSGRIAPGALNRAFDYNQVGFGTNASLAITPLWQSRLSLGLEGSRTRGTKRRELKEMYRALKTFVPGSGGGYNQNSFPIAGEAGGGLFSAVSGDTQGRAKASWTVPVIRDVDQLLWILYLERLDFTAFYNYGAAWNNDAPRVGWDKLIRAHGYSLDLQLENKGVRFNVGLGTGQVVGRDFEVYMTSGFDALF